MDINTKEVVEMCLVIILGIAMFYFMTKPDKN